MLIIKANLNSKKMAKILTESTPAINAANRKYDNNRIIIDSVHEFGFQDSPNSDYFSRLCKIF